MCAATKSRIRETLDLFAGAGADPTELVPGAGGEGGVKTPAETTTLLALACARGATLAIGNFANELKSLYWTDSGEVFLDESPMSGVGPTSFLALTFGLFFFDADLDGRTDLLLANGHVEPTVQADTFNIDGLVAAEPVWAPTGVAKGPSAASSKAGSATGRNWRFM